MSKFNGFYIGNIRESLTKSFDVTVFKGSLLIRIFDGNDETEATIKIGDTFIDPVTDDYVEIKYCSSNGFYVYDGKKNYLIPIKEGLFYNF